MARTDSLGHFLTDVADAIREKTGSSEEIVASDFDTEIENIPSGGGKYAPRTIKFSGYTGTNLVYETQNLDTSNLTSTSDMFSQCNNLTEIDISNWNTSNVANMSGMFSNTALSSLDLSSFDTSNVTIMYAMFSGCHFSQLNLNDLDLTNVFSMEQFVASNQQLTSFTLTNKTSNSLRAFSGMFYNCSSLSNVNLGIETFATGGTQTNRRIGLANMFGSCTSLTELDLSGLIINTAIYYTNNMFNGCTNLTKIDIRGLKLDGNIYSYNGMFNGVPNDCEIIVKDDTAKTWVTSKFTNLTNVKTAAEYEAE